MTVHVGDVTNTATAPDPTIHVKIIVDGEIEVCAGCVNSHGYNVAWEFAEPDHVDPVAVEQAMRDAGIETP